MTSILLNNGEKIVGVWRKADKASQKAIILAHGITVDKDESGAFIKLADELGKQGYNVFRFDFRGHGESSGKSTDFSVIHEVEDLQAVVDYTKKSGYEKIGILGASYGGGSSTIYLAKNPSTAIKCLCLWNPVLNYDHTFLNPVSPWLKDKKEQMQQDIAKKGWTTIGSKQYVLSKVFFDAMKKISPYQLLSKIKVPTLIIHGTKDTKVPYQDSVEYVKKLNQGSLKTINNADHGFHQNWEYEIAKKTTVEFFLKNFL